MKSKFLALVVCMLALFGCQSTGPIPVGQGAYMIAKKDGAPGVGISYKNKAAVYQEACEHCEKQGMDIKVIKEQVTPARPGQLGSTELTYICVEKGGEYKVPTKDLDQVQEVRVR